MRAERDKLDTFVQQHEKFVLLILHIFFLVSLLNWSIVISIKKAK